MNVKYLTIRDCNLLSLKELKNITSLEYLDISCNSVFSLKEVEVHKKLITLIIQNTMILDVSQVSELPCLQEFNAENCLIVNTRPLIDHPNFVPKWISLQQEPDSEQIQIYLDSYGNNDQNEKIKALLAQPPDYQTQMIQRYAPMVQNRQLSIENDQDITEFSFTDMIQAEDVQFNSCPNISFNITPKKLKKLTITNSNLTSIEGVQKIATLEYLNVSNNLLMFIEPIQTLIYLKQVFVDGNMIHDLRVIQNLPNFAWNPVKMQKEPTKEDYMIVLKEQYTESRTLELKKMFQSNRELDTQFFCMTHFKNLVQGKTLKITNNQEIDNIQFVDYFDIEELRIQNCYNIYFTKYPTKITKLTMNNCKLTTAKIQGLEQMEQLTDLNLGLNALTDDSLETIGYLKNLTNLNLSLNRFNNTSMHRYLTHTYSSSTFGPMNSFYFIFYYVIFNIFARVWQWFHTNFHKSNFH
ncbi:leucine-rich_repeat domain-containing protein [Hexamita inflata]|uniref:Leucine-rich repeat domain-containing protein n=1 Tax=Hexamita inflata TaxID=28002 RepID=A0AA86P8K1_9EUKA|nr:leucine-rich repeat domain-containing protein [Hexamita inflata]